MIERFLNLCVVTLFTTLTAVFGYCACTQEVWGPPFMAMILQGTATGAFAVFAAREYLK